LFLGKLCEFAAGGLRFLCAKVVTKAGKIVSAESSLTKREGNGSDIRKRDCRIGRRRTAPADICI